MEPPEEREPEPQNRFERYDVTVPTPAAGPARRSAIVTTAGVVLVVQGLAWGIAGIALKASGLRLAGTSLSAGATMGLGLVVAAVFLATAAGIFLLRPWARGLGIAIGALGLIAGLFRVSGGFSTLSTLVVNAFVIYALAVSGPLFRRR